jgi:hypothetical protein
MDAGEALKPLPRPLVWARYATQQAAQLAQQAQRFGESRWSVEYRPDGSPFSWALIDNGWKEQP